MSGKTIFQSVLMVIGGAIIVMNSSWWLLLGIFFALWGNNIQMEETSAEKQKRIDKEFNEKLKELEAE